MKKTMSFLASIALLLGLTFTAGLGQGMDLSGTWQGTTEIPDSQEVDEVILVLEKTEQGYTGTLTDSLGFAQHEEIENIEFEDNNLSFSFTIFNGEDYLQIVMHLTIDSENSMSGYWELEDGSSSSIQLKKSSQ